MRKLLRFQTLSVAFVLFSLCVPASFSAEVSAAVKVATYQELVSAIRGTRAESKVRVERAVEQERVREAWEIGRLIDEHILQRKERAAYAKKVLPRLAADLGMSETELYYMIKFARAYPILPQAGQLTWSEYRELLTVKDAKERDALAAQAEKENWSRERLREEVKAVKRKKKPTGPDESKKLTPPEMGQPGTYKIVLAKTGPYTGQLALDLGFSNYFKLSEILGEDLSAYKEGNIVVFYGKEVQVFPENFRELEIIGEA